MYLQSSKAYMEFLSHIVFGKCFLFLLIIDMLSSWDFFYLKKKSYFKKKPQDKVIYLADLYQL